MMWTICLPNDEKQKKVALARMACFMKRMQVSVSRLSFSLTPAKNRLSLAVYLGPEKYLNPRLPLLLKNA
jgi:hypothetical protein